MKEIKPNQIILTSDTWGDKLFNKVGEVLETLLAEQEICVVRDDDTGIIVIEHGHNEYVDYWGCDNPHWITDEEWDAVLSMREEAEHSEHFNQNDDEEEDDSAYFDITDYLFGKDHSKDEEEPAKEEPTEKIVVKDIKEPKKDETKKKTRRGGIIEECMDDDETKQ